MPLEEINPLHLVEQSRRITQMGPGGIPSDSSITMETAALHPSTFGFVSPIESPESERAGVDSRLTWGSRIGSDGKIYQKVKNSRTGKRQWVSSGDLAGKVVALPD
jgi:DNA-directed RNA polymerase beta subunit